MREILFRGKHKATGKWCEGNLHVNKQGVAIITPDDTPLGCYGQVDPDTVGQYTGLTDKYGKKIFEGDIVQLLDVGEVGCIVYKHSGFEMSSGGCSLCVSSQNERVVIGNFYDNPEPWKGGALDGR